MKRRNKKTENGQSLLEVITAVGVTVLVLVALVRLTTVSIRNAAFARNQAKATKLAGEVREKIRAYRETNSWDDFTANCENKGAIDYTDVAPFTASIDGYQPGTTSDCASTIDECEVLIKVTWTDGLGDHGSELVTRFTNWR